MRSFVWFRRDLRVSDNTALYHAAKKSDEGVVGLFVITPLQWKQHDDADCKVKFWLNNLAELSDALAKLRIPLRIETCDTYAELPLKIVKIANRYKCSSVYLNREYETNESRRDHDVTAKCEQANITVRKFHDRIIVPPREITTKEGKFYSVFTPFRRVWDTRALEFIEMTPKPHKQPELDIKSSNVPSKIPGFDFRQVRVDLWPAGEAEGQSRLGKFRKKIDSYHDSRDIPSIGGTSLLSPYLAAGVISPRQLLARARCGHLVVDRHTDHRRIWRQGTENRCGADDCGDVDVVRAPRYLGFYGCHHVGIDRGTTALAIEWTWRSAQSPRGDGC